MNGWRFGLAMRTYQLLGATPHVAVKELRETLAKQFLNAKARHQPPTNEWIESVFRQECDLVSAIAA